MKCRYPFQSDVAIPSERGHYDKRSEFLAGTNESTEFGKFEFLDQLWYSQLAQAQSVTIIN